MHGRPIFFVLPGTITLIYDLWFMNKDIYMKQFWKLSLGGATIGARMAEKMKISENGCKVCAHHFDHLEARWKKISTTAWAFYHIYCRCAPV